MNSVYIMIIIKGVIMYNTRGRLLIKMDSDLESNFASATIDLFHAKKH